MYITNTAVGHMDVEVVADRNAIRIEYEATGADPRILMLLSELEAAERNIETLTQRLGELESRLTRRCIVAPPKPATAASAV